MVVQTEVTIPNDVSKALSDFFAFGVNSQEIPQLNKSPCVTRLSIQTQLHPALLCLLAFVTASVVSSMLVAMLNSTFLLIAVYKYDCFKPSFPFEVYWDR